MDVVGLPLPQKIAPRIALHFTESISRAKTGHAVGRGQRIIGSDPEKKRHILAHRHC